MNAERGTDEYLNSKEAFGRFRHFLELHIQLLVKAEPTLRDEKKGRIAKLHPLFSSIIEDAISITLLASDSRLNDTYIISRALLERLINYCFLQICNEDEFDNFIKYSKQKGFRRLNRKLGTGLHGVELRYMGDVDLEEFPELKEAVEQFTSEMGKEITRWTKVGLPERAIEVEKVVKRGSLLMPLLIIYTDASEALHGTLYGSLFHFGVYDPGSVPHDQGSLLRNTYQHFVFLFLMVGGCLNLLLDFLVRSGVVDISSLRDESEKEYKKLAVESGLVQTKQSNNPLNPDAQKPRTC